MKITIAQLYPRDMNLYGDWGNTLVLKKRLERRGVSADSGLEKIDDTLANKAKEIALKLSR